MGTAGQRQSVPGARGQGCTRSTPAGIYRLVMSQGLIFVAAGILLGLLLSFCSAGFVFRGLCGVRPSDPYVYSAVTVCFLLMGALTSYLPARQAVKVDPMVAPRAE